MKIYLAGQNGKNRILSQMCKDNKLYLSDINILESYYDLQKNETIMPLLKKCNSYLIDSGAFSFMKKENAINSVKWDVYIENYAEFINKWDVKLFFELDIERIIGMRQTERLRTKLERLTGKKCIPVWHMNRGKNYFVDMCRDYPYVAYGSFITDNISLKKQEPYLDWFINTAHQNSAKIHGLGYTSIKGLHAHKFDSVDSTAWLVGNRAGFLWRFIPYEGDMIKIQSDLGHRLKPRESAFHNFKEWVKFGIYANKKL